MADSDKHDDDDSADNWEALALSRVARRVEQLPQPPAEADDFGWEEGILAKLRKRLAEGE
jgi:hypothetical protein